ncbi:MULTISPECIES: metal-dependent transcriptional regulator [unclassified Streptococcus]|uniref:metal-dependent transcriptional regulator n=1 Tax=unclassified Streptococcus TaxID=2608887 RepID=UPI0020C917C4|nr:MULTISPECIES: metal-dependent transcriptional regulator [unclassified Streptococcus]MCP8963206.1 metal-dependent transcriptional regulator [Streptococcus sp. CF8_St5-12]MCP8981106.1 metal-dependent transcriptional regulator [Streptococcus sp. CF8_St5-16]MCP8983532.1 metal-dependent transcriptional regulator [Streptococcus sp. CF8_St5-13]MCP9040129.1 metal-dependent transcriptional regulator [Streptococcus sp. CF8_St5-11]
MTPNKEDYLKCIYEIGTEVEKISNKEIASRMQVSPPAVTEMIKRMISEGLLVKDKSRGYLLTDLGSQLVSDLYRKHRLIEVFLLKNLDYTTEEVHEEAEVLEHTVSEHFIDKLDYMLGNPKTCPHGGTIPPKGQLLIEAYQDRLSDVSEPGTYRLRRVQDNFELLNFLDQIQLTIGDDILFKGYDDYTGLYHLAIHGQEISMNQVIAQQLYIEKHAL